MSLVLDRTLLIKDDSGLNRFFTPYHLSSNRHNKDNETELKHRSSINLESLEEWMNLPLHYDWLGDTVLAKNLSCLNDISSHCSLEAEKNDQKFLIYRSNRCFLCRYYHTTIFLKKLKLQYDINLYEIAGCMLRLVLWPTDFLWKLLDDHYFHFFKKEENIFLKENENFHQIAIHHRCGDHHYNHHQKEKDCNYENAYPLDLVHCATKYLQDKSFNNNRSIIVFVTADSKMASHTIVRELRPTLEKSNHRIYLAPSGCHVDLRDSNQTKSYAYDCMHTTIVPWFMMALSQTYFVQTDDYKHAFSGYSRSAGIYSLYSNPFILGDKCTIADVRASGMSLGMSWIC